MLINSSCGARMFAHGALFFMCLGTLVSSPPAQAQQLTEREQRELDEQGDVCGNYSDFFNAFITFESVRRAYSAPMIEQRRLAQPGAVVTKVPSSQYLKFFDITKMDWDYSDTASVARWHADPTNRYVLLDVELRAFPDGSFKATYQKGEFEDDGEGDGKTLIRRYGPRAAYVFARKNGCWQLTQHLR